jgi:NAD(P)-dependent dehydrogenase (short-subunit alcohol dehydrogenase family)
MTNKIALITGGSRGLGRNTALAMAKQGIDVVLTYQSKQALAQAVVDEITAMGGKAVALPLDVAQVKTFDAFASALKQALQTHFQSEKFDFLINNAGTGLTAPFAETTEQVFDDMVNIHLKSTFFVTQKLLPLINDGGRIINISSGLARFTLPGYSAYAAMKGGIEVLTRYMAKELGARQIAVNTVAPGAIETDFGQGLVRDNKEVNAYIAS